MTATSAKDLTADGFVRRGTVPSALAYWVWPIALAVQTDRDLRLTESTILRLIRAGVSDPDRISGLMGLEDSGIVASTVARLMRLDAVHHEAGRLQVTPGGEVVLEKSLVREPMTASTFAVLDPYRKAALITDDLSGYLTDRNVHDLGLHSLSHPPTPTARDLAAHHLAFQSQIGEAAGLRSGGANLQLLRVVPQGSAEARFKQIDVELWQRPQDFSWAWQALIDGVPDQRVASELQAIEKAGGDILPVVRIPAPCEVDPVERALAAIFDAAQDGQSAPIDQLDQVAAVRLVLPAQPHRKAMGALLVALVERLEYEQRVGDDPQAPQVWLKVHGRPGRDSNSGMSRSAPPVDWLYSLGCRVERLPGTLTHGALSFDDHHYVVRCHIDPLRGREGAAVAWAEYRAVPPSDALLRILRCSS